jgi:hypothetical protein
MLSQYDKLYQEASQSSIKNQIMKKCFALIHGGYYPEAVNLIGLLEERSIKELQLDKLRIELHLARFVKLDAEARTFVSAIAEKYRNLSSQLRHHWS